MLSVWWGVGGLIHRKLLPDGCHIAADLYCQQLDCVAAKLQGKQDRVYFLHDNARPHLAKSTHLREKKFDDENDLKMGLVKFFGQKSWDFYGRKILSLPERC